jgi:hypothetical protein
MQEAGRWNKNETRNNFRDKEDEEVLCTNGDSKRVVGLEGRGSTKVKKCNSSGRFSFRFEEGNELENRF